MAMHFGIPAREDVTMPWKLATLVSSAKAIFTAYSMSYSLKIIILIKMVSHSIMNRLYLERHRLQIPAHSSPITSDHMGSRTTLMFINVVP